MVGKGLLDSLNPWLSRAGPALPVQGGDTTIYNLQIIYGAHLFSSI